MQFRFTSGLRKWASSPMLLGLISALSLVSSPINAAKCSIQSEAVVAGQSEPAGTPSANPREEAIIRSYNQQMSSCVASMKAGKHDLSTSLVCRNAADAAAEFAPDQRYVEKRTADVYAATALANSGDMVAGLRYADRAIDMIKLGHDDYAGGEAAYSTRAMIESGLRNWEAADPDLALAEEFARKGLARAQQEKYAAAVAGYRQALSRDLRTHAVVLTQLKRPSEAQAKLTEAARY